MAAALFSLRMASMNAFPTKPTIVQLTDSGAARIPYGDTWMIFDVDSLAPNCMHTPANGIATYEIIVTGKTPLECSDEITKFGYFVRAITNLSESVLIPSRRVS
jgi:hypothetical protein